LPDMRCTFQLRGDWSFRLMEGRCKRKNSVSDDRHAARPAAILWVDLKMMGKIEFGRAEAKWRKESAWRDGWRGGHGPRDTHRRPRGDGERRCPEEMKGHGYRELPPSCVCLLPVNNPHPIHPKQKKYIYPTSSATSPTLIFTNSYFIDLHLQIPITYLAGYPPAHTPSGESLTDLIHRVTSGLIINILPYPCRPFHPPPLDLNDHRALYWNRPFVASSSYRIHPPRIGSPTCASYL
jgi:hypothetical protein